MVELLRVCIAIIKDPISVANIHVGWLTNTINSSSRGSDTLFWSYRVPEHTWQTCIHIHTCTHTHTHESQLNKIGNVIVLMRRIKIYNELLLQINHPKGQGSKKFYVAQIQMYKKDTSSEKILISLCTCTILT